MDTAWIKIPPELYRQDRKVVFSLKKVRGDYVTSLGLTLYQRDPRRGRGGGQAGEPVELPARDVFAVYPNPAKSGVQVEYSLREPGRVVLSVYDVLGRLVRKVVDGEQPAGVHKRSWDGKNQDAGLVPGGVYFVRLNTPDGAKTKRLAVLR